MFEVVCTGRNENYGKKGEKRLLSDYYVLVALKAGWITTELAYTPQSTKHRLKLNIEYLPVVRLDALKVLKEQTDAMERLTERINNILRFELDKIVVQQQKIIEWLQNQEGSALQRLPSAKKYRRNTNVRI